MKKNVGTYDALMRITCGLTGLAWGTARMIRRPNSSMPMLITMASAMKVAEGITRFCPMLAMLGKDSVDNEEPLLGTLKKATSKAVNTSVGSVIDELAQDDSQQSQGYNAQGYTREQYD